MSDEVGVDVFGGSRARPGAGERAFGGDPLDLVESGVRADRPALLADHLHAVVFGRVVAGRNHHAPIKAITRGRKVHHLGPDHPEIGNIDPGIVEPSGECGRWARPGQADVVSDANAAGARGVGIGPPDSIREVFVEFRGDLPRTSYALKQASSLPMGRRFTRNRRPRTRES